MSTYISLRASYLRHSTVRFPIHSRMYISKSHPSHDLKTFHHKNFLGKVTVICSQLNKKYVSQRQLWFQFDVCLSVQLCICVEKRNQLDVTECFIALIICSTCFGHFYAHHQELESICVLLPPMVCSALLLVVGGQVQSSRLCVHEEGCCTTGIVQHPSSSTHSLLPCTWPRQPATKHCTP